jgi:uncharacterized membrane protein
MSEHLKRWDLQKEDKENAVVVTSNLIQALGLKVTRSSIERKLMGDADYPSFQAIVNGLDEWNIDTFAAEAGAEHLPELPYPCIFHLNQKGGYFVVGIGVTEKGISCIDPAIGEVSIPVDDFLNDWSGAVLLAEANEGSGEEDYEEKLKIEQQKKNFIPRLLSLSSLFLLSLLIYIGLKSSTSSLMLTGGALLILHLAGMFLSVLLAKTKYKTSSALGEFLCTLNEKADCDEVINSTGGKILGFDLVDVGIVYFSTASLFLLFGATAGTLDVSIWTLAILGLCSIPFTIYSVFYQWRILQKWCVMCLFVVALLWLNVIIHVMAGSIDFTSIPNLTDMLLLIPSFLLVLVTWMGIKKLLPAHLEATDLKNRLSRMETNPHFINGLIAASPTVDLSGIQNWLIVNYGDDLPVLSVYLSPSCGPCINRFPDIVKQTTNKMNLRIILITNSSYDLDSNLFVCRITSYVHANQHQKAFEGVQYWYALAKAEKPKTSWFEKYTAIEENESKYLQGINDNVTWMTQQSINTVPAIILDDMPISLEFGMETIKAIVRAKAPVLEKVD